MQKKILFLFVPLCLIICCKSDSSSYNDVVKEASKQLNTSSEVKDSDTLEANSNVPKSEDIVDNEMENSINSEEVDNSPLESSPKEVQNDTPTKTITSTKKKASVQKGVMSFDNNVYEFGTINEGDIIKHDFYFTNTGKGPITVKKASATCGCTVPSYPFIPINPGERGYIGVTYNSVGKSGVQTPVVTVVSDARESVVKLKLTGKVMDKSNEVSEKVDSSTLPQ